MWCGTGTVLRIKQIFILLFLSLLMVTIDNNSNKRITRLQDQPLALNVEKFSSPCHSVFHLCVAAVSEVEDVNARGVARKNCGKLNRTCKRNVRNCERRNKRNPTAIETCIDNIREKLTMVAVETTPQPNVQEPTLAVTEATVTETGP